MGWVRNRTDWPVPKHKIMKAEIKKELADGSAIYEFKLEDDEIDMLLKIGIVTVIKEAIAKAKEYHGEEDCSPGS